MIPVGLVIAVIAAFVRASQAAASQGPVPPARVGGKDVPFRTVLRPLALFLGVVLTGTFLLGTYTWLFEEHVAPSVALGALGIALLALGLPEVLLAWVLAPLGLVRSAAVLVGAMDVPSTPERGGTALLAAARVVAARPSEPRMRWVARRIDGAFQVGTIGATAAALLDASAGDLDRARLGFRLIADSRFRPSRATIFARDWLAADAARRGDWRAFKQLGRVELGPLARLFHAIAARGENATPADDRRLRTRWLLAPNRIATFSFVRRALRTKIAPASAPLIGASALGAHRALLALSPTQITSKDVARAITSIESITGSSRAVADLARRGLALSVPLDAEAARAAFVSTLENDVIAAVAPTDLSLGRLASSPTLERIRDGVRTSRRAAVDLVVADVYARAMSRRDLSQRDEWVAWSEIFAALARAQRSASPAELAVLHQVAYHRLTHWAVRLSNVRGMRVLAAHVFTVLREVAERANDVAASGLLGRNTLACDTDRLPWRASLPGTAIGDASGNGTARVRFTLFAGAAVLASVIGAVVVSRLGHPSLAIVPFACLGIPLFVAAMVKQVEVSLTDDGLFVQSAYGAYYVAIDEVVVAGFPPRLVWLRPLRRPTWLPGLLVTFSSSRETTQTALAALARRRS